MSLAQETRASPDRVRATPQPFPSYLRSLARAVTRPSPYPHTTGDRRAPSITGASSWSAAGTPPGHRKKRTHPSGGGDHGIGSPTLAVGELFSARTSPDGKRLRALQMVGMVLVQLPAKRFLGDVGPDLVEVLFVPDDVLMVVPLPEGRPPAYPEFG